MPVRLRPAKLLNSDPQLPDMWWDRHWVDGRASFHVGIEASRRDQRVEINERQIREFISFMEYQRTMRGSREWQAIDHVSFMKVIARWTGGGMEDHRLRMLIRVDDAEANPPVKDWPMFTEHQVSEALTWFIKPDRTPTPPDLPETKLSPLEMENEALRQQLKNKDLEIAHLRDLLARSKKEGP